MKYQFFTIPVHASDSVQETLNRFCAGHRIVTVDKQFVADGQRSFWSMCVGYLGESEATNSRKGKIDYREVLDEKDFSIFAKLRTLRKSLAEEEGVPAYALFTNEQLASMARQKINSITAMSEIEGVGKSRIEKYGDAFLTAIQQECSGNMSEAES